MDNSSNTTNKVAFSSFPRSGNTFLRKYFELLTGVQTGADNTLHTNVTLQMSGMKGEDIVDDTVWIIKTHSPWCMPFAPPFKANKNIVVVRNPLDVIISWLNLCTTATHHSRAPFDFSIEYPQFWDWWVRDCTIRMRNWYRVVIDDAVTRRVPTIFIRYEDLTSNPDV